MLQVGGGAMDLLETIDAMIDGRHLLTHPFYRSWVAGTLPSDALQEYARQYFAFESSFPQVLSALLSRSDRADVRQAWRPCTPTSARSRRWPRRRSTGCGSATGSPTPARSASSRRTRSWT